jgi:hypothetical protein
MANAPVYVGTPQVWQAALSAANTNADGTGTIVDVLTAGTLGTRLDEVRVQASGTTSLGAIRLYLYDGTSTYCFREISVPAVTPSIGVTERWSAVINLDGLVLPAGGTWKLRASTNNAEAFKVFVKGGNL